MRKILVPLLVLMALGTGCQKSLVGDSVDAASTLQGNNSTMNCKVGAADTLDPNTLQIQGAAVASAGQTVSYQLNQDLSCSSKDQVSWKAVSTNATGSGQAMKSKFASAGTYVVTAKVDSPNQIDPVQVSMKTVVVSGSMDVTGPQVGMVNLTLNFDLAVPSGINVVSASWNFGDGSAAQSSLGPLSYAYHRAGSYTMTVAVTDDTGAVTNLTHPVTILPLADDISCVTDLALSTPSEATTGVPVAMSVFIPSCLTSKIVAVSWNFGDGTTDSNQNVNHTYTTAGDYTIVVTLYNVTSGTTPWATLTQEIHVTDPVTTPTPTPSPTPAPTPTPTPNPLACPTSGDTRQSTGDLYTENASCGVNGTKVMTYHDVTTQVCQDSGDGLVWSQGTTVKTLVNEGPCQGQACAVPASAAAEVNGAGLTLINGQYYMNDGTTKTFYTTSAPDASCDTVSQTRTCANGVLSGSTSASHLSCQNGCPGFGPNGTVHTGVVTGTTQVAKTCQFGETGIFDIYTQTSTQTCQNGQVVNSNTQQGTIQTPGVCPVYTWTGSDQWSACSADCGGTQTQVFTCTDGSGVVAPNDHCSGAAPVQTRVCDGNPAAVAHSDVSTSTEDAGASAVCPANQIGVVTSERTVTTTTNYACIDHQVQVAGTTTSDGPWQTESYCRDYVPHRCSQDSLSTSQAKGRLAWMVKCQDQIPVVKQFLQEFATVKVTVSGVQYSIQSNGRDLYPTFMNHSTNPEKVYIAPTTAALGCEVPNGIYVAAVCLSSCATPEQEIMTQAKANMKLKYTSFIDALTNNDQFVGTLGSNSGMSSKLVQKTKVDLWVTELLDTEHEILEFHMKSGGILRLTPNHPLVSAYGTMLLAADFKVGDSMVRLGGELDPIVDIVQQTYYGKVYNLFVKSASVQQNIVVTNGYLNGTAFFQNEGALNINRALFRQQLTQGAFGQ